MRPDDFEGRMRRLECFHSLRVPDGAWVVLRLDGRGFTRFADAPPGGEPRADSGVPAT